MRFPQFDMRSTRLSQFQTDKFVLISPVWDKFFEKCIVYYKSGQNITVDNNYSQIKPAADLQNIWSIN